MNKFLFVLIFTFLGIVNVFSKNLDSIEYETHNNNAFKHYKNSNYDKAISEWKAALKLSNTENDKIKCFIRLGISYKLISKYDSAFYYYNKAIDFVPESSYVLIGKIYNNIGTLCLNTCAYKKAEENLLFALKYKTMNNDSIGLASTLLNLGEVQLKLNNLQKAKEYYLKSLEIRKKVADTFGIASCYINLGIVEKKRGIYTRAEYYYNKVLKLCDAGFERSKTIRMITYENFGAMKLKTGMVDEALKFYYLALDIANKTNSSLDIAYNTNEIALINLKKNYPDEALKFALKSFKIAENSNILEIKNNCSETLFKIYEYVGDYKNAVMWLKKHLVYEDSILNAEKLRQIQGMEYEYQTKQKEQKIALLEKENQLKRSEIKQKAQQRNWLTGFFIVILIIAVIIYYFYKKTKSDKNKIETLQREIHHRVKNNLAINRRMVEVAQEKTNDEESKQILQQLETRIASMSEIHEQLCGKKDVTNIDFIKYLDDINRNIASTFEMDVPDIKKSFSGTVEMGFDKTVPLGLIVNELITNAYKYAGNGSEKPKVVIDINKISNKLIILVSDNGKGFPEGFDINDVQSYGLKLVNGLTRQLNGTIRFFNSEGAVVEIVVPL